MAESADAAYVNAVPILVYSNEDERAEAESLFREQKVTLIVQRSEIGPTGKDRYPFLAYFEGAVIAVTSTPRDARRSILMHRRASNWQLH